MVERAKRELDHIVADLLLPLLQARPAAGGWRLVNWDVEQGVCITLARGDAWLLVELERRDDARECYARTRIFNVCARRQLQPDLSMTSEERRVVDQLVELVRKREGRLPMAPRPAPARGSEVREIVVDRMLM